MIIFSLSKCRALPTRAFWMRQGRHFVFLAYNCSCDAGFDMIERMLNKPRVKAVIMRKSRTRSRMRHISIHCCWIADSASFFRELFTSLRMQLPMRMIDDPMLSSLVCWKQAQTKTLTYKQVHEITITTSPPRNQTQQKNSTEKKYRPRSCYLRWIWN